MTDSSRGSETNRRPTDQSFQQSTTLTAPSLSFSHDVYERFLTDVLDAGYEFVGFSPSGPDDGDVILRHDVDLSPQRALEMARLEADLGVRSTYLFLLTTPVYNLLEIEHVEALEEIASLGHDVGVHFNTHHYWDDQPPVAELVETVRSECETLGRLLDRDVSVVSPHVPPEWMLGRDFAAFTNAYGTPYFDEIEYVSDSNQKWRDEPPLPDGTPRAMQILVHPGLWGPTDRQMDDIVAELEDECHDRVEEYVDPLGA